MISRICIGFALLATSGLASTGTAPKSSGIPSDTIQPFELQPFLVPAHPVLEGGVLAPILSAGIPETPESAIRAFETTPGLSIGSRGPSSKEPNIRGLSFDRVLTTWNGLPLPNAAPTRTGSPINTSSLLAGSTMDIHLTGNDLISGPGVSGGRIVFETPAGLQSGIEHSLAHLSFASNPLGISVAARSAWHIQTQFRIDQHTDEARSTHRHTLGKPVHEWYTAYAGAKDPETRVTHTLPSLSFQTAWRPSLRPWAIHAAVAATSQNPTPTERFRAMLPALGGGYEIGNPNLDPEAQVRGEVAFHLESRRGFIHFTAWHSRFDSFIQRHAIGPYQSAPLFSFRNVDARLSGIEWASSFDLLTHRSRLSDGYPRLDLPLAISWTTGDFLDPDGAWTSLAEIPPLRIRTGIEHSFAHDQRRFRLAAYATWEASRSNPDPNLFPTLSDSGDHLTFDIEAKIWAASTWSVELQVRNVGNLEYARHLSPRPSIPLANGSPLPSDKAIPDPGRSFLLSLSKSF